MAVNLPLVCPWGGLYIRVVTDGPPWLRVVAPDTCGAGKVWGRGGRGTTADKEDGIDNETGAGGRSWNVLVPSW